MALGRKAAQPVKMVLAIDGEGITDPAVDVENSDLKAYWESNFDMKHIKIRDGWSPTYFTIRPLTRRQKDAVDALIGQRAIASWYVRCGLLKLENYEIYDANDIPHPAPSPILKKYGDMGEIASEEWLDEVSFTIDVRDTLFISIANITEAKAPLVVPSEQESGVAK